MHERRINFPDPCDRVINFLAVKHTCALPPYLFCCLKIGSCKIRDAIRRTAGSDFIYDVDYPYIIFFQPAVNPMYPNNAFSKNYFML